MLQRIVRSLAYLRPRSLARMHKAIDVLSEDVRGLSASMRALTDRRGSTSQLEAMQRDLAEVRDTLALVSRRQAQLQAIALADGELDRYYDGLGDVLNEKAIRSHVHQAIQRAPLHAEPFPYLIVENLFPASFYEALIRGLPPVELFEGERNRRQLAVPLTLGPAYSRRVWRFMAVTVTDRVMASTMLERMREPLDEWLSRDWPALTAAPEGSAIGMHASKGRILLRERGYNIPPHRDPKWGFITCLMYLARPGDSQSWGTSLYAIDGDEEAAGAQPHWVNEERCRLAAEIPFRPNSALIFLNSKGAHGASIPADAEPADLERYAYQFRLGPKRSEISSLMSQLPDHRQAAWAGKITDY